MTTGLPGPLASAHWRLRVYAFALILVLATGAVVTPPSFGQAGWVALAIGIGAIAVGALSPPPARLRRLLAPGAILAVTLANLPLILNLAVGQGTLAARVADAPVWAPAMASLIGSRVLALDSDIAFALFWQNPAGQGAPARQQSSAAALALGLFLTLMAYLALGQFATEGSGPVGRMIISALKGATLIHGGIMLLFATIVALLAEGWMRLQADRRTVRGLGAFGQELGVAGARRAVADGLGEAVATRGYQEIVAAIGPDDHARTWLARRGFHTASRRFLRTLLPLLPLLGFLGTVIGLATAIAELPAGIRPGAAPDISGSLAGLAVKFETTLLGLMASMVATVALNALERGEAELSAEILRRVDALVGPEA